MAELTAFIGAQINIPPDQLSRITSRFSPRTLRKGKHFLTKGQIASEYIFVERGALRVYTVSGEREITGWIAFEGEFFGELNSLKSGLPTKFSIQAVEDTQLLTIHHLDMDSLYAAYPVWQEFGRKIWELAFQRVVEGILAHQTMTAEERYAQMLRQSELVQRVPLKHLASFLGVTPTSLSRLRKKIR
jgi:CRP-like cAMP-binding protein